MTSRSGGLIVALGGLSVKSTTEAKRKIRDVSVFKYWKKEKLVIIKKVRYIYAGERSIESRRPSWVNL